VNACHRYAEIDPFGSLSDGALGNDSSARGLELASPLIVLLTSATVGTLCAAYRDINLTRAPNFIIT
jgi:hypothetical protein